MPIASVNPYTNQTIRTFSAHSDEQIRTVLKTAGETFRTWRTTSFAHRRERMHAAAELLKQKKTEYARLMTLEMGKPVREAVAEIEKCAGVCAYYADHAEAFLQNEEIESDASQSYIAYDPLGAVLAIMPWNFPYWQVFRFAAPALMAGNVGVLKHASNVPQCALAIESVFTEAGFPVGAFQTLLVENSKVEMMIADPTIQAVTLTGSDAAGASVAAIAGKHIKKTVMELGGSDPFIVLADADLEQAAQTAVNARMMNTGQSCICAKRFIVAESIADDFIAQMKHRMQQLKTGDPMDETTDYGPMAREDLAEELQKQVNASVEKGATIVLGGDRPKRAGAFFNPTILTNVRPGMPAYDDELFGPVAAVMVVGDDDEAVAVANASRYGLGAAIWTRNTERGQQLARRVESGAVFINGMVKSDPRLPFGGVKKSGYGRELSHLGIREFMNIKTVWVG